jgi:signal transduction histidine kinase
MPTARARNTRTPLNAVLGFAQLLEREAAGLAPRQRLQVERIKISALRGIQWDSALAGARSSLPRDAYS